MVLKVCWAELPTDPMVWRNVATMLTQMDDERIAAAKASAENGLPGAEVPAVEREDYSALGVLEVVLRTCPAGWVTGRQYAHALAYDGAADGTPDAAIKASQALEDAFLETVAGGIRALRGPVTEAGGKVAFEASGDRLSDDALRWISASGLAIPLGRIVMEWHSLGEKDRGNFGGPQPSGLAALSSTAEVAPRLRAG